MTDHIKDFYRTYADKITDKRVHAPYPLRRYAHEMQYQSILHHIAPDMKVLDAGCGEGSLSILMAKKGAQVTGIDISEPNIAACRNFAAEEGLSAIEFLVGDVEMLPFAEQTFDLVVSSHVLEHLPNFDKGLTEIMRVSKKRAIVAIPTIFNACSFVQVGHGWFYLPGPRSFLALPYGFLRMLGALISGKEGVDEQYVGTTMPHIFRFPWVLPNKARRYGYHITYQEASTLCLPYFSFLLPIIRILDMLRRTLVFRNFGYGTTYIIEK